MRGRSASVQTFAALDEKDCSPVRSLQAIMPEICSVALKDNGGTGQTRAVSLWRLRFIGSQLPKGTRKKAGQRVFAWTGEK